MIFLNGWVLNFVILVLLLVILFGLIFDLEVLFLFDLYVFVVILVIFFFGFVCWVGVYVILWEG